MTSIDGTILDFKRLDHLSVTGTTALHHLDARAKVLVTLAFIISVVSFEKYEVTALFPFVFYPVFMVSRAGLPPSFILKKIALVIPLAVFVGIFNPIFDREIILRVGSYSISGGWVSMLSITSRAALTVGAAFILVSVSGFPAICRALGQLGVPQVFSMQLLFLYRYIFVLAEEGARASMARELRSFGTRGSGIRSYAALVGYLLLRTWQRAERIHMAMLARGFSGEFPLNRPSRFGRNEYCFTLGWCFFFVLLRLVNIPQLLGSNIFGVFK